MAKKSTTKKSQTKKRAKIHDNSAPRINQREPTIDEHRALVRKARLTELREMKRTLSDGWKKAAVVRRIEEIDRGRADFIASLQSMGDFKLRKLTSPDSPKWQRDEATKVIQRREREFAVALASMGLKELQVLISEVRPAWQQHAAKRRFDELHIEEVAKFRTYLNALNLRKLRSLVFSFSEKWKTEEVSNRIEILLNRNHEREVETFARSLHEMSVDMLEALTQSTSEVWKHDEITKRIAEERLRQHAQEKIQFNDSLKGMSIEDLCKLASTIFDGWQNEEICRRIIEMVPSLKSEVLDDLSKTSVAGLRSATAKAKDEIRWRKKRTEKLIPKKQDRWV